MGFVVPWCARQLHFIYRRRFQGVTNCRIAPQTLFEHPTQHRHIAIDVVLNLDSVQTADVLLQGAARHEIGIARNKVSRRGSSSSISRARKAPALRRSRARRRSKRRRRSSGEYRGPRFFRHHDPLLAVGLCFRLRGFLRLHPNPGPEILGLRQHLSCSNSGIRAAHRAARLDDNCKMVFLSEECGRRCSRQTTARAWESSSLDFLVDQAS